MCKAEFKIESFGWWLASIQLIGHWLDVQVHLEILAHMTSSKTDMQGSLLKWLLDPNQVLSMATTKGRNFQTV